MLERSTEMVKILRGKNFSQKSKLFSSLILLHIECIKQSLKKIAIKLCFIYC